MMKVSRYDKELAGKAKVLIEKDLHRHFSVQELAEEIGMSKSKLKRVFFYCFALQPYAYLREQRMREAWVLLKESDLSVKQIAFRLGFKCLSSFSTSFTKRFGINPSKVPTP